MIFEIYISIAANLRLKKKVVIGIKKTKNKKPDVKTGLLINN